MIVFLSFAPIEFMGGAEKWFLSTAKFVSQSEPAEIINVSKPIADSYGKLVLKRAFDIRTSTAEIKKQIPLSSIQAKHFIPFSKNWQLVRKKLRKANVIYIKFEVLEVFLLVYFGGFALLKKTVAGIHSPYQYSDKKSFFNRLHTYVYKSFPIHLVLRSMKRIHVLNKRDETFFKDTFHLHNVVLIPNGAEVPTYVEYPSNKDDEKLTHILFAGELCLRKGVDRLCEVIKQSPSYFQFHIAGDGPMKDDIIKMSKFYKNVSYYGHLSKEKLLGLYQQCSILFFPSRAESMGLVILEALSYGLCIVSSKEVTLDMPAGIEYTNMNSDMDSYVAIFRMIRKNPNKNAAKQAIQTYFVENYSINKVNNMLYKELFSNY